MVGALSAGNPFGNRDYPDRLRGQPVRRRNLRNYLEKLFHAVARHVTGHPTVARKYRPTGENSPFIIVDTLNYRETVKGNHSKVVSSSE